MDGGSSGKIASYGVCYDGCCGGTAGNSARSVVDGFGSQLWSLETSGVVRCRDQLCCGCSANRGLEVYNGVVQMVDRGVWLLTQRPIPWSL